MNTFGGLYTEDSDAEDDLLSLAPVSVVSFEDDVEFLEAEDEIPIDLLQRCIRQSIRRLKKHPVDYTRVQAVPGSEMLASYVKSKVIEYISDCDGLKTVTDQVMSMLLNTSETLIITLTQLALAKDWKGVILALLSGFKMLTHKSLILEATKWTKQLTEYLLALFPSKRSQISGDHEHVQALATEDFEETISMSRKLLTCYNEIKNSIVVKKIERLFQYFLSFGLLEGLGLNFAKCHYSDLEAERIRDSKKSYTDFFMSIYDSVTFILERGVQAIKYGSLLPFYHSEKTYVDWALAAKRLEEDSHKMANPAACGLDPHKFTHDLSDAIEKGESIVRFASKGKESDLVQGLLRTLRLIKANMLTKNAAQQEREAPFAVLVSGDSSIGKSKFSELLFQVYGKIFNLETTSEYKYTRICKDEFWSGFNSAKWCIVMDDIAMFRPTQVPMDPSLIELISIINNVPFTPPMADLEDKGRHPVLAKFVIATTNQEDLNADAYFCCPLAILRRLKWVFDLQVKPRYAQDDCPTMIDPAKLNLDNEEWPNYWNITVKRVSAVTNPQNTKRTIPKILEVQTFTDIYDFMEFFGCLAKTAATFQQANLDSTVAMSAVAICKKCCRPTTRCTCETERSIEDMMDEINPKEHAQGREVVDLTVPEDLLFSDEPIPLSDTSSFATDGTEFMDSLEQPISYEDYMAIVRQNGAYDDMVEMYRKSRAPIKSLPSTRSDFSLTSEEFCEWETLGESDSTSVFEALRVTAVEAVLCARIGAMKFMNAKTSFFAFVSSKVKHSFVAFWTSSVIEELKIMGRRVAGFLTGKKVLAFLGCFAGVASVYGIYSFLHNPATLVQTEPVVNPEGREILGSILPGEKPDGSDATVNVWHFDELQVHKFDLGKSTLSQKGFTREQVADQLKNNLAFMRVHYKNDDGTPMKIDGRALCVGGHLWVTNDHIFPKHADGFFRVEFCTAEVAHGITPNTTLEIYESNLLRREYNDKTYFRVNISPRKVIKEFFPKNPVCGSVGNGFMIGRNESGKVTERSLKNMRFAAIHVPAFNHIYPSWVAVPETITQDGECGTPYIMMSGAGPMIMGIHQTGGIKGKCTAVQIVQSEIDEAIAYFDEILVSEGEPMVQATKLVNVHPKSPFHFVEAGQGKLYGSFSNGFRAEMKSKVAPTLIKDAAVRRGFVSRCGKPVMKGWEPVRKGMLPTVEMSHNCNQSIIDECVKGFIHDIDSRLDPEWLKELKPLDDLTTINGAAGVKFIDKMKRNTSMGFPYRKSKKYFLENINDPEHPDFVNFRPEVYEEINRILAAYKRGERAHPVFIATLKDEPLPEKKIKMKKTRVFQCAPATWSFVVRKMLLPFIRVFQKNPLIFEGAPGMNCGSRQWEQLKVYLCAFGDDQMIAGDYAAFDKHMQSTFMLAAWRVIIHFYRRAGWSDEDLRMLQCIAEDTTFSLCDYFGDLIEFCGSNPSGHPLTVILNCLVNSLYIRYCYHVLNPKREVMSFKEFVHLITYGDDNEMGVSKTIPWFNHTALVKVLALIDVVYTMADKEAESVPFVNIADTTFLKRKWRWDPDVCAWLAPLDWSSIEKMLTMGMESDFLCPEERAMAVIESAMGEFFFYGREVFERNAALMRDIISECDLWAFIKRSTLPTWDQCVERFNRANENVAVELELPEESEENKLSWMY